jgi:hypothetical protein
LASLGAAAASLRTLIIAAYLKEGMSHNECVVSVGFTRDSIPCAFSGLRQFVFQAKGMGTAAAAAHSIDLVALLEAAPELDLITVVGIPNLSWETSQWIMQHRPGYNLTLRDARSVIALKLQ